MPVLPGEHQATEVDGGPACDDAGAERRKLKREQHAAPRQRSPDDPGSAIICCRFRHGEQIRMPARGGAPEFIVAALAVGRPERSKLGAAGALDNCYVFVFANC